MLLELPSGSLRGSWVFFLLKVLLGVLLKSCAVWVAWILDSVLCVRGFIIAVLQWKKNIRVTIKVFTASFFILRFAQAFLSYSA